MTRDLGAALEDVVCTGADRVLTSGGEPDAHSGRHRIRDLVRASNGRIRIIAGGGVRASNAAEIAYTSGVREFHASLRQTTPSPVKHQVAGTFRRSRRGQLCSQWSAGGRCAGSAGSHRSGKQGKTWFRITTRTMSEFVH